jgi:hypothetical protein
MIAIYVSGDVFRDVFARGRLLVLPFNMESSQKAYSRVMASDMRILWIGFNVGCLTQRPSLEVEKPPALKFVRGTLTYKPPALSLRTYICYLCSWL